MQVSTIKYNIFLLLYLETNYTYQYVVICLLDYFSFRYGSPGSIISDQGREFVNSLNKELLILTNTTHKIASAYHPQTNGLIERYNQMLQRSLLKLVNDKQDNWNVFLDGVLFAYRTAVHKSTGITPFEVMFCRYASCLQLAQ